MFDVGQPNVTCPTVSYADGTSVTLTVKLIAPTLDDVGIISAEGCDSTTRLSCTVLMNANKAVKIRVSSPI